MTCVLTCHLEVVIFLAHLFFAFTGAVRWLFVLSWRGEKGGWWCTALVRDTGGTPA